MTLLIDPPMWPAHGRRWSHLASDSSLLELHRFAAAMGIPERGFEGDHYDVPEERYAAIVTAGAMPVSSRELLRRLRASGLRRPKRRGERVVASRTDVAAGYRVDTVLSALSVPGPVTAAHLVLVRGAELLVQPDGEGRALPSVGVGPGENPLELAATRAVSLIGPGASLFQVGYLRRVPDGSYRPTECQVVFRGGQGQGPAGHVPDPLGWVPVEQAAALLSPDLAVLARLGPHAPERGHH